MTPPQGLTVGKVILACEGEFDELNRCHFSMWWMEDHQRSDLWAPDHGRRPHVRVQDFYADPQEHAASARANGKTAIVRV